MILPSGASLAQFAKPAQLIAFGCDPNSWFCRQLWSPSNSSVALPIINELEDLIIPLLFLLNELPLGRYTVRLKRSNHATEPFPLHPIRHVSVPAENDLLANILHRRGHLHAVPRGTRFHAPIP